LRFILAYAKNLIV